MVEPITKFQYIDADGGVTELNDFIHTWDVSGQKNFYNLPFALNAFESPLTPGESVTSVKTKAREVDYPMLITAANPKEFIEKMRSLAAALNPDKGAGVLRVSHATTYARELRCRYVRGLEGNGNGKGWSPQTGLVVLTFRASDPFFYPVTWKTQTFTLSAPVNFFPFFPLRLTQDSIFSSTTVTNEGDSIAYPVWTITGPCTSARLKNMTTGEEIEVTLTVSGGVTMEIDTRPGIKSVTSSGANYFYALSSTSVLWGLQRGANELQLELGNTDANTRVELKWKEPFLSW